MYILCNKSQYGKCKITADSEVQFHSENVTVTFVGYGCAIKAAKQLSDLWQLCKLTILCQNLVQVTAYWLQ